MDFWNSCLSTLREKFSEEQFKIFISQISLSISGETLTLTMPSSSGANWVRRNETLTKTLTSLARNTLGMQNPSIVVARDDSPAQAEDDQEAPAAPASAPETGVAEAPSAGKEKGETGLNPQYKFENFIEGKANQLAMVAGFNIASDNGVKNHNPLFIWGNVGLGKTHLAQAIGNLYADRNPARRVRYITSNDFVGNVVRAFRDNQAEGFKRYFHSLDMLIVDDIQFFAGDKVRTEEEFFCLFNFLVDQGRPLILTSDRLPGQIGVHRRLTTRFQSGLLVSIEPPELELRIGILQRKAEEMGAEIDESVTRYIADKLKSNVRELEGALHRIVAYARFRGAPSITLDICRKALADILGGIQPSTVTPATVQQAVADYYKIRVGDLKSARRTKAITRPRHVAIYLTRQITELSLPEIGQAFGGRNHTTVIHACRNIENLLRQSPEFEREISILQNLIVC